MMIFRHISYLRKAPEGDQNLYLFPKFDYTQWRGYGQFFQTLCGYGMLDVRTTGKPARGAGFDWIDRQIGQILGLCDLLRTQRDEGIKTPVPSGLPRKDTPWFCLVSPKPYDGGSEDECWGMRTVDGCFLPALRTVWDLSLSSEAKREPFCGCFSYLVNGLRWYFNSYSFRNHGFGDIEPFDQLELDIGQQRVEAEYARVRDGLLARMQQT